MAPLGGRLLPALLLGLLFGPGLVLEEVFPGKRRLVFVFQLGQHLLSLFLPVLVLVADGVRVYRRLCEVWERFPPQLGHLGQAEEGEATGQRGKV